MNTDDSSIPFTRRDTLRLTAAAATGLFAAASPAAESPALKGRIKQSICYWCFRESWSVEQLAAIAKQLGCVSVELVEAKYWPLLKQLGLTCAISSSHGFVKGMNNLAHWDYCFEILRKRIDDASAAGVPSVITFTGMRESIPDDVGLKNCVEGYKKIVGYAEEKKVTLCLEMLNSRDSSHP